MEYYIMADSGGGDDHNPHQSLIDALQRIEAVDGNETGLEVWAVPIGMDPDDAIADGEATRVWWHW